MTAIRNGCVPKAMLLPVGDRLYWLVDGRYNESDSAYLDVSNLDAVTAAAWPRRRPA